MESQSTGLVTYPRFLGLALDKNPMPGHLFYGNPVDEGTTQGGTGNPVHRPENPTGSTYSSTTGLSPLKQRERQAEFPSSDKTRPEYPIPTLQARFDLSQKWRGNLRFLPQPEMRPSSIKTNPVESREATPISTVSLTSHRHSEKLLEATGKRRGK